MKTNFMTTVSRTFKKASVQLKHHAPEIMVIGGVIGVVTSTVLACKASTKVNAIIDKSKKDIEEIHHYAEQGYISTPNEIVPYSKEDSKKDLTIVYAQTGVKLVKLYAPAVVIGVASITGILYSHRLLRKENAAMVAAYTALDTSFKDYRKRVVERFGKEMDRELKFNIKSKEIEERVVDENGNEKVVKKTVDVIDPNQHNANSIVYDNGNTGWSKDPAISKAFLIGQQAFLNQKLQRDRYLFLNDVYDALGAPRTPWGHKVGWIYDPNNCDHEGDNYVDFGIFDANNEKARDFINGRERCVVLDFNVDGVIDDKIKVWDVR